MPRPSLKLSGIFVAVLVVGLGLGWVLGSSERPEVANIGGSAPDFTVELIDGDTFDLSRHLTEDGRPLLLNQWASWCLPCRTEIPEISAFAEKYLEVKVLGVAVEDTETAAKEFANEIDASYDLALGNDEFESSYPRLGLPVTYVIDQDGNVVDIFNGIVTIDVLEGLVFG